MAARNSTCYKILYNCAEIEQKHVIAPGQPIGIKQKRSFKYSTAHELSSGHKLGIILPN